MAGKYRKVHAQLSRKVQKVLRTESEKGGKIDTGEEIDMRQKMLHEAHDNPVTSFPH